LLIACEQDQDVRPDPARKLYDIYHCCVYSEKTPDDGQRNCPRHVEFYFKNKFEKLVHLVGFIIRTVLYIYIYIYIISVAKRKPCKISTACGIMHRRRIIPQAVNTV